MRTGAGNEQRDCNPWQRHSTHMANQQRAVVQPGNRRGPKVDACRGIRVSDLHQALPGEHALRTRLRWRATRYGTSERCCLGVAQVMHKLQGGGVEEELGGAPPRLVALSASCEWRWQWRRQAAKQPAAKQQRPRLRHWHLSHQLLRASRACGCDRTTAQRHREQSDEPRRRHSASQLVYMRGWLGWTG